MMNLPYDLAARRPYLEPEFSVAEYDRRRQTVLAGMAAQGLDALIVHCGASSYASIRWLTSYQPFGGTCFVVKRRDALRLR